MYGFLKTLLINWFFPFPLCLGISLVGLVFLWIPNRQKTGKILVTVGLYFLILFSLPFIPNWLLTRLEQQHDAFTTNQVGESRLADIKYVVVLAGGHVLDERLPITSQFLYPGIVRLIEGIRLHKMIPGSKLVLSGGPGMHPVAEAELMLQLSIELGIPRNDIVLETKSVSTLDQARLIKSIVWAERFLLVTSASHMVRAVALFEGLGMDPVPAPTDYLVKHHDKGSSIMPSSTNVLKSDSMAYEYLGLIKEKLLGNI